MTIKEASVNELLDTLSTGIIRGGPNSNFLETSSGKISLTDTNLYKWYEEGLIIVEVVARFQSSLSPSNAGALAKWASIRLRAGKWNEKNWLYTSGDNLRKGNRSKQLLVARGNNLHYFFALEPTKEAIRGEYGPVRFDITKKDKSQEMISGIKDHLNWVPIVLWHGDSLQCRAFDLSLDEEGNYILYREANERVEASNPRNLYYLLKPYLPSIGS